MSQCRNIRIPGHVGGPSLPSLCDLDGGRPELQVGQDAHPCVHGMLLKDF